MIKTGDKFNVSDTNIENNKRNYGDIKPDSRLTKEEVNSFWNSVFDSSQGEIKSSEVELSDVFNRFENEDEFAFILNHDDFKAIDYFNESIWHNLNQKEKRQAIELLVDDLSEFLDIKKINVEWFTDDDGELGYYNPEKHTINLNESLMDDPKELADTIAHEMRHAYQDQKAMNPQSRKDYLYRLNFENYISPVWIGNGQCLFFTDYYNQYVEVEARAFAKAVVNCGGQV